MMRIGTLIAISLSSAALMFAACDKKGDEKKGDDKKAVVKKGDDKKAAAKKDDDKKGPEEVKKSVEAPKPDGAMKGHDMKGMKPAAAKTDGGAPAAAGTATAGEHGKTLLFGYERVRLALAADDFEAAKKQAGVLAMSSTTSAVKVDAALTAHFKGLAAAAGKVAAAADVKAGRLAFGDLSKLTITVIVASKDLSTGVTTYRCPMAGKYKKWIQLDANMANPYMGKRMLKCGGKVKLEV